MSTQSLDERGKALEGKFFHDREQQQIDALRAKKAKELAIAELADITGFADRDILTRVVELGVTPMTWAAFSVIPLLHVAWSDKVLDDAERKAILLEANASGLKSTSPAYALLEGWLTERPNDELFAAWSAYHEALAAHLTPAQKSAVKDEILGRAERVARASGGFLGFASVSSEEHAAMKTLVDLLS